MTIAGFFNVFKQKFILKILLIPLTAQRYNFGSKGPRGLKFVMLIDPPHVGPSTTFLF